MSVCLQELEEELYSTRDQRSVLEESSMQAFEDVEEKLKIIHEQERVSYTALCSCKS